LLSDGTPWGGVRDELFMCECYDLARRLFC